MLSNRSLKAFAAILVKAGTNGRDDPEAHVPPGGWPGFAGMSRPCWHKGKRELIAAGLIRQEGTGKRAVLIVLEGGLVPEGDGTVHSAVSKVHRALMALSPSDLRAFLALTLAADRDTGDSFASMDTVARWSNMPRRTFYRALRRLKAASLYRRVRKGRWRINPHGPKGAPFGYVRRDTLAKFGISMDNENCKRSGTSTVSGAALDCKHSGTETVSGVAPVPEPLSEPVPEPSTRDVGTSPTDFIPPGWIRPIEPERRAYTRTEALAALQGRKPIREHSQVADENSPRAGWRDGRYHLPMI